MKVKHHLKKTLLFGVAFTFLMATEGQSQSRYSTWSDPNAPLQSRSIEMENLLGELESMVREAEKARAADPNFLRDLNDLVTRYKSAETKTQSNTTRRIFMDDFADGDFTRNPVWTVAAGKYWVEQNYGLRSFVEMAPSRANANPQTTPQQLTGEELVIGILGAVLGAQNQQRNKDSQGQQNQQASNDAGRAEIFHSTRINNAFDVNLDFSSWIRELLAFRLIREVRARPDIV